MTVSNIINRACKGNSISNIQPVDVESVVRRAEVRARGQVHETLPSYLYGSGAAGMRQWSRERREAQCY